MHFKLSNIKQKYKTILQVIAFLFVIGISIFIFSIRNDAVKLAYIGYPGVFLLAFLSYATVILPAPGLAIIFTMGGLLTNPLLVAFIAGSGAAIGELTGYLAGFSGQAVVERMDVYQKLIPWMKRNGPLTIFVLSAIPNPFFDLAGIAAGALKLPLGRFFLWCWTGEITKMLIFAYLGSGFVRYFF